MSSDIPRGAVYAWENYLQAHSLDQSNWNFNSNRTPSDIDSVHDVGGNIIFFEYARSPVPLRWNDLKHGQRLMYKNVLAGKPGCVAMLCVHDVPLTKCIDVTNDITAACVANNTFTAEVMLNAKEYVSVVRTWDNSPEDALNMLRDINAEQSGGDA